MRSPQRIFPVDPRLIQSREYSFGYAKLTFQTMFIINAGALIGFPSFVQILGSDSVAQTCASVSAHFDFVGIWHYIFTKYGPACAPAALLPFVASLAIVASAAICAFGAMYLSQFSFNRSFSRPAQRMWGFASMGMGTLTVFFGFACVYLFLVGAQVAGQWLAGAGRLDSGHLGGSFGEAPIICGAASPEGECFRYFLDSQ